MRTTITLDDDVAAALERVREEQGVPFKQVVNSTLRTGLWVVSHNEGAREEFRRTEAEDLGQPYLPNVDDVAEVLAYAEGEDFG